jgi:hypothetical protein
MGWNIYSNGTAISTPLTASNGKGRAEKGEEKREEYVEISNCRVSTEICERYGTDLKKN